MRGRPPLSVGTYGDIRITATKAGTQKARCRYRDMDGVTREVTATGPTKRAATDALLAKLKERTQGHDDQLTPASRITDLARVWLSQLGDDISASTRETYAGAIERHIQPKIGELRISELRTSRADKFLEQVAQKHEGPMSRADGTPIMIGGPTAAKTARVVLTGMMGLAARYDIIDVNPVREARTPAIPSAKVRALTSEELQTLIDRVQEWATSATHGPAKDSAVLDMIDVMVGTGMRPGEVLALRWSDGVDLGEDPAVIVTGTVTRTKEHGLRREDKPKTDTSIRRIRVPGFVVSVLRRRYLKSGGNDIVFPNAKGSWREPANLRRLWKNARGEEFDWVTPKTFRAAVATIIDREADSLSAASQLGHSSDSVTRKHYIEKDRTVTDNRDILTRFREAK